MKNREKEDKIVINNDSDFLLLEELFTKVQKEGNVTDKEFKASINGFYLDIKDKSDDMVCRIMEYKPLGPPRADDFYYLIKIKEYEETNNTVEILKDSVYNVRNHIIESIGTVLESSSIENIKFLLSQKKLFDEYYDDFLVNLKSYFEKGEMISFTQKFYRVKIKMLENQEALKKQ